MAIKYEAYTRGGEKVTGVLDTDSEDTAYTMLEEEELTPYKLRQVRPLPSLVQLAPWLFKPKPQEIIDFTRQLSSLLDSGIPIRRALMVQRDQARGAGMRAALQQVTRDIEAGERFSVAFSRHPTVFPEFYRRMMAVGESTGGIPFALQQLTQNLQRRRAVSERVRKALVVPAISMVVAFFAGIVMVTY